MKVWFSRPINDTKALQLFAWKDSKVLRILTSFHNKNVYEPEAATTDRRRRRFNDTLQRKPLAVIDYKKIMPGVDRQDQQISYYSAKRLGLKRVHKLMFMEYFETSMFNSFVVYKELNERTLRKSYDYLKFKENLFGQIYLKYGPNDAPSVMEEIQPFVPQRPQLHSAELNRVNNTLKHRPFKSTSRNCAQCNMACPHDIAGTECPTGLQCQRTRKRTTHMCKDCDVNLCIEADPDKNCFDLWHEPETSRKKVSMIF